MPRRGKGPAAPVGRDDRRSFGTALLGDRGRLTLAERARALAPWQAMLDAVREAIPGARLHLHNGGLWLHVPHAGLARVGKDGAVWHGPVRRSLSVRQRWAVARAARAWWDDGEPGGRAA